MVRARSYGSYARNRNRGFNPPILPDVSEKMLREGERTIKSQADAYQAEINNRQDIARQMADNASMRRASDAELFQTEMDFSRARRDAELQHYRTAIKDVEVRKAEWERNKETRDAVVAMIPKAVQAYGQFEQQRGKVMQEEYDRIMSSMELTADEKNHIAFVGRSADKIDTRLRSIIERESKAGRLNDRDKDHLLTLSGRRELIAQKWAIKNTSPQIIQNYLTRNLNTPLQFGDEWLTLQSVINNGNPDDINRVLTRHHTKLISQQWGVDSNNKKSYLLLNETFTPAWNKAVKVHRGTAAANFSANVHQQSILHDRTGYANAATSDNPSVAIYDALQVQSAGNSANYAAQKNVLGGVLQQGFSVSGGAFTTEVYNRLENTTLRINDQDMSLQDYLGKEWWSAISEANTNRINAEYEISQAKQKVYDNDAIMEWQQIVATNGPQTAEFKAKWAYEKWGSRKPPKAWDDFLNVEQVDERLEEGILTTKYDDEGITWSELTSGQYSKRAIDKWGKLADGGPNSLNKRDQSQGYNKFQAAVKEHAENVAVSELLKDGTIHVIQKGERRIRQNFERNIGNFPTVEEAWDHAIQTEMDLIKADSDIYELVKGEDGKTKLVDGGFKIESQRVTYQARHGEYINKIMEDDKFILNGKIHDDDIHAIDQVRLGNDMPGIVQKMAAYYPKLGQYTIANLLLERHGKKPLTPPGMHGLSTVLPGERLESKPSVAKTETILEKYNDNKDKPLILEAHKSKKAVNRSEDPYKYVEMNGIQSEKSETQTALDYINLSRDNPDAQFELGPYLLNYEKLLEATNKGWILPNEPLGEQQLDKIKREQLWDSTSKIKINGQEIPGVGHSWLKVKQINLKDFPWSDEFNRDQFIDIFGGR